MKIILIILGIGVLAGAVWFFTRPAKEETKTTTQTQTTQNTGLSGLLGGLNLSGLTLFGV